MFGTMLYKCIIYIWLVVEVYAADSTLPIKTFRCKNGMYIRESWFCDKENDCGDYSDERNPECLQTTCGSGHFACDNTCKNISVYCNTKPDCLDGSDESDCENEPMINDCTWQEGKYLCEDNLKCIHLSKTCDNECNCYDCSDEKSECSNDKEIKKHENGVFPYVCFKTPNGPHCCSEIDSLCHECDDNQCEQKCIEFSQMQRCMCDENYVGVPETDNRQCVSNEASKITLMYSTENSITALDLSTNTSYIIKEGIEATALAGAHYQMYYATFTNGTGRIFTTSMLFNETREFTNSDSKILAIAIDWITNNTYYSTNKSEIVACSEDGKICKQVKSCNAHSIGLAPRFGLLFWVETKENDNSSQYIMKSGMDGSDEALLIVWDKDSWPIAISVDELKERIYFWTSPLELSFISFHGNSKKILQSQTNSPSNRAFFTVFDRTVYYSLLKSNQIYVAKNTSKLFNATLLPYTNADSPINHLYTYNARLQRTKIRNPCDKIRIDGLCLLRPSTSKDTLNYNCFHDEFNGSCENSNKDDTEFVYKVIIVAFVAIIFIICLKITMSLLIRRKKMQLKNEQSRETDVPLESRENNSNF